MWLSKGAEEKSRVTRLTERKEMDKETRRRKSLMHVIKSAEWKDWRTPKGGHKPRKKKGRQQTIHLLLLLKQNSQFQGIIIILKMN